MDVRPSYKRTEVGVIPEDWDEMEYTRIGDIIDGDRGVNYPSSGDFQNSGHCLFLNAGNVTKTGFQFENCQFISADRDGKLNKGKLSRQDVVLTTRGTLGNLAYFSEEVPYDHIRINSGMVIMRSTSSTVDHAYHYFVLRSRIVGSQIERLSFGSAQPQLTVKGIETLKIPLPPTKAEQEAIAKALNDADALIESLEQLLTKKRQIKKSAMQELLTGRKRLPGFSGKWEVKRLGEFVSIRNQKVLPSGLDADTLCIELDHIGQGDGQLFEYSAAKYSISSKYRFFSGDVLFGRLRSYLRKFWHADRDGICSTEIWPLMVDPEQAKSDFLYAIVQSDEFIATASISYGTHMPRADWDVLRNFPASLPKPEEQTTIATVLSEMDAEIGALESRLSKARLLGQGMMQELLTGRIRLV